MGRERNGTHFMQARNAPMSRHSFLPNPDCRLLCPTNPMTQGHAGKNPGKVNGTPLQLISVGLQDSVFGGSFVSCSRANPKGSHYPGALWSFTFASCSSLEPVSQTKK